MSARKLSPTERDAIKARIAAHDHYAAIAVAFGCTVDAVKYYARKMKPVIAAAKAEREAAAIDRGLSAVDTRVAQLEALFWRLQADLESGIYGTDIKLSASGKAVAVPVFKAQQFAQARGLLDDIAKERGGRKVRAEVMGKEGEPVVFTLTFDRLTDAGDELPHAGTTRP